jgi:3-isopropylmalate/(R)-2-methylmalate dehydratase large subunit
MSEKIFAAKAGRDVRPGEYVMLEPDIALANDITAPVAIDEFRKAGGTRLRHPERTVLVPDHFTPNKDIKSAAQARLLREFAAEQGVEHYFEVGRMGIEHVLLPEQGIVRSGDLVVGADSHTCTYGALGAFATGVGSTDIAGVYLTGLAWFKVPASIRVQLTGEFRPGVSGKDLVLYLIRELGVDGANYRALEFTGPGVAAVSMDSRFTVSNMAIEAGGKAGLFPVDERTAAYEQERGIDVEPFGPDDRANWEQTLEIDLAEVPPMVAYPNLPSLGKAAAEAAREGIRVDQVIIGSCTNGRIEDLRTAAAVLKGKKVAPHVRCIIIPGSQQVYLEAVEEGLAKIFVEAECAFSTPTCGPCLGGHMGILAQGETAVSTTNRNFTGRMGHTESRVFLAGPAVAAASAVAGYLTGGVGPAAELAASAASSPADSRPAAGSAAAATASVTPSSAADHLQKGAQE